jgi:chromosome segregation protein
MKLAFIEIAGFRGFKDKARFDLPSGFAVLTGRNGVGKSTVLDAIDFALTGTINKYAVRDAKGGGLSEHIWWVGEGTPEDQYVTVGFKDENGTSFDITRSRRRGINIPEIDIARRLCITEVPTPTWLQTLLQTTLIRDETIASLSLDLPEQARFSAVRAAIGGLAGPDHTKRTGAILEAASVTRASHVKRVADAQAELGRALGALTEARSLAARQADINEAEQLINAFAPDLVRASGERVEVLRRHIADRKQSLSLLAEVLVQAEALKAEQLELQSEAGLAKFAAAKDEYATAQQNREQATESLMTAQRLEALEREIDAFASHMMALLDYGESLGLQDGHCPLCNATRSSGEFTDAIAAARSKLSTRGEGAAHAATAIEQARFEMKQAEMALSIAEQRVQALEAQRTKLLRETEILATTLAKLHLAATVPLAPENLRQLLLKGKEDTARLERALFILETSSAHDRVTALEDHIEQLRMQLSEENARLASAERTIDVVRQINNAAMEIPNQVMTEQFDTVMPLLKELYQRLRPHTDWSEIEIDFGGRVRASLNFVVGDEYNPQFLFSSGQRRAAGIAFLLAIHLSRPWSRLHSLLLDDPVQHIDDYRALNLVEVLSAVRRTGRQVIVAVEDPALADVLCRRLRSTNLDAGRRFELGTSKNGSAVIERQVDIFPLPRAILKIAG